MNIPVITVCSNIDHIERLTKSLQKQGWLYFVLEKEWKGFGTKIIETYTFLQEHPEIEQFIFCDAYDVVALGTEKEFIDKLPECNMLLSTERGLWPPTMEIFRKRYTEYPHRFNFPNSGLYYAKSDFFKIIFEANQPEYYSDDQEYMHGQYLSGIPIQLDPEQNLFHSHSFLSEGECGYENGRLQINGNQPIFAHSNGRHVDPELEKLL